MKHNYTKMMAAGLMAAAMTVPATASAEKAVRKAVVENYGDMMYGGNDLTTKVVSYYDSLNRLSRKIETDAEGTLQSYYYHFYNDKGLICNSYLRRYQELSLDTWGLADPDLVTNYEYDADGNITLKEGSTATFKYYYDEKGNMVKQERYDKDYLTNELSLVQTWVYSDFLENATNCPKKYVSSSDVYTSYNFEAELEYNDNTDLVKETQYIYDDNNVRTYANSTIYTYDKDYQLLSTVRHQMTDIYDPQTWEKTSTEEMPVDSVVYTYSDGGNTILQETYTYDTTDKEEPWAKSPAYTITRMQEFDGALSATLKVEEVAGKINTNKITVTVPEAAEGYSFNVFRDGVKITTISLEKGDEAFDFDDEGVKNGEHEYFVETVKPASGDEAAVDYNISNTVTVENKVELPAPTNVRGVSKGVTEGDFSSTCMTIAWDAPKYSDELGFQGYSVFETSDYGDSQLNYESLISDNQYTIDMYNYYTERTIYVQAQYAYGTANSETVTVKMDELPDASGIDGVQTAAGKVAYSNGVLTTAKAAKISVMDASGKKVGEADNATSLSLDAMPNGIYVVSVQCDGKLSIVKVRK